MTRTHAIQAVAELTRPGGALDLGRDRARLLVRMIRLLALGRPISRQDALDSTAEAGIDSTTANALLDAWTERNDHGDIVGLGLTHNPTSHRMTIDGVQMWAWCGMDTLLFAHLLGRPITVESTAPSGDLVRLHASVTGIGHLAPGEAVITQRVPGRHDTDISTKTALWGTFCHHNLFFPDRAQAEQWAAGRGDVAILSIADGFTVAKDMATALLRHEPEETR